MKIILDAMGGDLAPKAPVLGALAADKKYEIVLVGDSDAIWEVLKEQGHTTLPENISVVHTTEVVDMHDDPANAVRQKKNSSMICRKPYKGRWILCVIRWMRARTN